jgi:ribonucleoside-triphosphate reductase
MSHFENKPLSESFPETKKASRKEIPVEVYSRVVGYYRPVNQWNKGKKEEFEQRKEFTLESIARCIAVEID